MSDTDLRQAIAAERHELAALLTDLPEKAWDAATLCTGWRVREVAAHLSMPFRYTVPRVLIGMVRARGSFDRVADRFARRDAACMTAAQLAAAIGDNADHPWKPPGGGFDGALSHDTIHGLDITVALGIERHIPEDRIRIVLRGIEKARHHFGVDLDGIELRADDLDWTLGRGTPIHGYARISYWSCAAGGCPRAGCAANPADGSRTWQPSEFRPIAQLRVDQNVMASAGPDGRSTSGERGEYRADGRSAVAVRRFSSSPSPRAVDLRSEEPSDHADQCDRIVGEDGVGLSGAPGYGRVLGRGPRHAHHRGQR